MSPNAVIVDAIRSPVGKGRMSKNDRPGGSLSTVHPVELLGQVLRQLFARNEIDPGEVDDVITGCVSQVGEQTGPVGRFAWLAAGLPEHVPSTAVNRACGSSQQAADFAAQAVMAGAYDVVIASGVESMSRIPMLSARIGQDPFGPSVQQRYAPGLIPQGVSAEIIAARNGFDRRCLDAFAARSHRLAGSTEFTSQIVPISTPEGTLVTVDETVRPGTTVEGLGSLPAAFQSDEMSARFPEVQWHITAGNSSQLADAASAILIMSEDRAKQLNLRPLARFHSFAVVGDDPITMLNGPIPATEKILRRSGLKLADIDHYEINEAFAPIPLAWQAHFHTDPERLNPRGGAIALGHPLGASGARLLTTMLGALKASGGRYGLQAMCEAGGMANATIIEML